jgi:hypothetical protein
MQKEWSRDFMFLLEQLLEDHQNVCFGQTPFLSTFPSFSLEEIYEASKELQD